MKSVSLPSSICNSTYLDLQGERMKLLNFLLLQNQPSNQTETKPQNSLCINIANSEKIIS